MGKNILLIDKLNSTKELTKEEFISLFSTFTDEDIEYARSIACKIRDKWYGKKIYLRGLIEISSICKNDCFYCGIRRSNSAAERYRLSKEDILECCATGYSLGYKTFVLQGGEDLYYNDDVLCDIISSIKKLYPDVAVTLSIGEKTYHQYKKYYDAGADRYLLRHETANEEHYYKLHPQSMSFTNRIECLYNLKKIGYQVGTGFMVESPYQTPETLAEDFIFLKKLNPDMVGIGPYIVHHSTPFANEQSGTSRTTLFLLSLIRIMLPYVLLPATTSLGTIDNDGQIKGFLSGANVMMPNLSPVNVRKKYLLYDNKLCSGNEAAEFKSSLCKKLKTFGFEVLDSRGDVKKEPLHN
ncbi:[FeFe] hydrogenase H-cluster radical SAM maturase HydE [Lachnobacterium bovis]|uniref:[FeFe] hydrogenase H-cluster radical SAM maturase HydE n=1 Tax=Lachnobacterium bovis TaxID=140626 RepID=UPI0005545B00|nr:[FeFe] hydrogenase H-cluster radical SAM maturase HydE [Lachnobacterium bovis]